MSCISFKQTSDCGRQMACRMILESESIFPQAMRSSEEEIHEIITDKGAITLFGFIDGEYFGNVYGCQEQSPSDAIYIYNIAVKDEFQGMGLGSKLMAEFIKKARERNYKSILGHFRHNGSLQIAKKFGAIELDIIPDWDGTGETFSSCIIIL